MHLQIVLSHIIMLIMCYSNYINSNPINETQVDPSEPVRTRQPATPARARHPRHGLQPVTGRVRVWVSTPGVTPVSIPNHLQCMGLRSRQQ